LVNEDEAVQVRAIFALYLELQGLLPVVEELQRRGWTNKRWANRDVHDTSKNTTLPIAREIVEAYVTDDVKLPWYIDLLNINIENHDLMEAKRRIRLLAEAFRKDGTRITENLDF